MSDKEAKQIQIFSDILEESDKIAEDINKGIVDAVNEDKNIEEFLKKEEGKLNNFFSGKIKEIEQIVEDFPLDILPEIDLTEFDNAEIIDDILDDVLKSPDPDSGEVVVKRESEKTQTPEETKAIKTNEFINKQIQEKLAAIEAARETRLSDAYAKGEKIMKGMGSSLRRSVEIEYENRQKHIETLRGNLETMGILTPVDAPKTKDELVDIFKGKMMKVANNINEYVEEKPTLNIKGGIESRQYGRVIFAFNHGEHNSSSASTQCDYTKKVPNNFDVLTFTKPMHTYNTNEYIDQKIITELLGVLWSNNSGKKNRLFEEGDDNTLKNFYGCGEFYESGDEICDQRLYGEAEDSWHKVTRDKHKELFKQRIDEGRYDESLKKYIENYAIIGGYGSGNQMADETDKSRINTLTNSCSPPPNVNCNADISEKKIAVSMDEFENGKRKNMYVSKQGMYLTNFFSKIKKDPKLSSDNGKYLVIIMHCFLPPSPFVYRYRNIHNKIHEKAKKKFYGDMIDNDRCHGLLFDNSDLGRNPRFEPYYNLTKDLLKNPEQGEYIQKVGVSAQGKPILKYKQGPGESVIGDINDLSKYFMLKNEDNEDEDKTLDKLQKFKPYTEITIGEDGEPNVIEEKSFIYKDNMLIVPEYLYDFSKIINEFWQGETQCTYDRIISFIIHDIIILRNAFEDIYPLTAYDCKKFRIERSKKTVKSIIIKELNELHNTVRIFLKIKKDRNTLLKKYNVKEKHPGVIFTKEGVMSGIRNDIINLQSKTAVQLEALYEKLRISFEALNDPSLRPGGGGEESYEELLLKPKSKISDFYEKDTKITIYPLSIKDEESRINYDEEIFREATEKKNIDEIIQDFNSVNDSILNNYCSQYSIIKAYNPDNSKEGLDYPPEIEN